MANTVKQIVRFFEQVDQPIQTDPFKIITDYNTLSLEVSGQEDAFLFIVEGKVESQWRELSGADLNNMTIAKEITNPGFYQFSLLGLKEIRLHLINVDSEVGVVGRIVD